MKKEMVAMLLAGGQGSRLGILTSTKAKPGICFGGRYRIIDFPLSNCTNSGVDTVGVLTQYRPLSLNRHIGIGIPWDLDKNNGGATILAPQMKDGTEEDWFSGTADAIFKNIEYLNTYNPEYVLILSGDHIYKMDYSDMLKNHKDNNADVTIAVLEVSIDEAKRFGIMNTKEGSDEIYEFEEKPEFPKSNLASMGIYIFTWEKLKAALINSSKQDKNSDFGKHIIPTMLNDGDRLMAYRFNKYWKDVGTIESYWEANMDLVKTVPEFNLYEDFDKFYTNSDSLVPQYTSANAEVIDSLLADGCEVYGTVKNSVLGPEVTVEEGAVVESSIIFGSCTIGKNTKIIRSIIDESVEVGENCTIGRTCTAEEGMKTPNVLSPNIYNTGITVIGENSYIPNNIKIGINCVVMGTTKNDDYINEELVDGGTIMNVEEEVK